MSRPAVLMLAGCASLVACAQHTAAPIVREPRVAAALAGLADGPACLIVRFPDGTEEASDAAACAPRLRPASTFKLPNALIAADVGLLDGPDAVLPYDAAAYPAQPSWPAGWAQDQPLRTALEISAVPLFRGLATRIGAARMQAHLDAFGYGNRSIAGGLEAFWLNGGLAISAVEQVDFLGRLVAGALPVSARAHEIVRAATPTEVADGATLHWKTGTGDLDGGAWVGWLVGWIDRPDRAAPAVFACWIQRPASDSFDAVRTARTRACRGALARLGLFAAPPP